MKSHPNNLIRRILLLAGAFIFAFLLGEMVHEYGHYFSHLIFGSTETSVYLNPFGSSHIRGVTSLPLNQMGITSAAGPLFNLFLGSLMLLLLWKHKSPTLLPLILWGPVAMIQESVTFNFGFLTPGGDAAWIAAWGVPSSVIISFGVLLLITGLIFIAFLLSSRGITKNESFVHRLLIILLGMCSLMLIRFTYSAIASPEYIIENLIPIVFSLLLALIVVLIQPLVMKIFLQGESIQSKRITRKDVNISLAMGAGMFIFQILYSVMV